MPRSILSVLLALCLVATGFPVSRADAVGGPGDGPGTRIGGFFRELVGYLKRRDRVSVGDMAPDFDLVPLRFHDFARDEPDEQRNARADAYRGVALRSFRGVRPVALIFGSYT